MDEIKGQVCPMCNKKGLTLTEDTVEVPYFGKVYVFSMTCSECKYHKADVEVAETQEPAKYTLEIDSEEEIIANFRFVVFEYPSRMVAGEINSIGLGLPTLTIKKGLQKLTMKIPALNLKAGDYTIAYNLFSLDNNIISVGEASNKIIVKGSGIGETHNQIPIVMLN